MNLKLAIQILIGAVGYSVWAAMAYFDPAQRADFLHFNVAMAVGTIGLVLRDMKTPADSSPTTTEQVTK
jgi:short-subunit dehydrogenase